MIYKFGLTGSITIEGNLTEEQALETAMEQIGMAPYDYLDVTVENGDSD